MEKYGIKETKEVLAFGVALGMAIDKSLADDGKISLADAANLVDPLMKAPAALSGITEVGLELSDLSDAEKQELYEYAKAELKLSSEKIEAVVEEALGLALSLGKIVALLKA